MGTNRIDCQWTLRSRFGSSERFGQNRSYESDLLSEHHLTTEVKRGEVNVRRWLRPAHCALSKTLCIARLPDKPSLLVALSVVVWY